jgi:hypothetical protein
MRACLVYAAMILSSLSLAPLAALARPTDTPAPAATMSPVADHPRDGGIIAGKITNVDFVHSTIAVNRLQINVMPSTQIQGSDSGYHAITDLKRGMSVQVYTSQVSGKYFAQIITLR